MYVGVVPLCPIIGAGGCACADVGRLNPAELVLNVEVCALGQFGGVH